MPDTYYTLGATGDICPVRETGLDITKPSITQWRSSGGRSEWPVVSRIQTQVESVHKANGVFTPEQDKC